MHWGGWSVAVVTMIECCALRACRVGSTSRDSSYSPGPHLDRHSARRSSRFSLALPSSSASRRRLYAAALAEMHSGLRHPPLGRALPMSLLLAGTKVLIALMILLHPVPGA